MLGDQLLDNLRYSAALQAGKSRQVSPRNGLPRANQLQNDIPIDPSRRFARG
jgi:hypothetical protein